jgi:Na+/H+-dicarboxylate symporter
MINFRNIESLEPPSFSEGIGLILSIDWFLDRCRTTVNVWGDMVGAAVIDRFTATDP